MPQPYRGDGNVKFAVADILDHPVLAAHIAKIAMMWTFSEDAWAFFLGAMLGFEAGAGLTMYHALTGTGAQRSVLNEVADQYLPAEFREEFNSVMLETRRRAKERNTVVHGIWFLDPALPDVLILGPRNVMSSILGRAVRRAVAAKLLGQPQPTGTKSDYSEWRTYRERDFTAIEDRIRDLVKRQDALIDRYRAALGIVEEYPPNLRPLSG
jgi:hypothetical protein